MTNHVHVMLATKEKELPDVVKPLAISYARYYNTKYSRCGYLFQDRFKSEPVDDFNYAVTLFRYIHQNPVKAGIVEAVEKYPWSSWHDYLSDKGRVNTITETSFMLEQIGMDDLCRLVSESVDDDCSHLEKVVPPTDLEVTEMLLEECHGMPIERISSLPKQDRDKILISVLHFRFAKRSWNQTTVQTFSGWLQHYKKTQKRIIFPVPVIHSHIRRTSESHSATPSGAMEWLSLCKKHSPKHPAHPTRWAFCCPSS